MENNPIIILTWGSALSSSDKQSIALLNTSSTNFFSWAKNIHNEEKRIRFEDTANKEPINYLRRKCWELRANN